MGDPNNPNDPSNRQDPLPVFCFKVTLDGGKGEAFFKSASGLRYETEVVPVREGGVNDTTFNLVGGTKWSNIILKQGYTGSSDLLSWREEWISGKMTRRGGVITQMNTALKEIASWTFTRGWPCKWEIAEFDAAKSELAIETLEIAHEGITWSKPGQKK
jgi:phage tail-like protein